MDAWVASLNERDERAMVSPLWGFVYRYHSSAASQSGAALGPVAVVRLGPRFGDHLVTRTLQPWVRFLPAHRGCEDHADLRHGRRRLTAEAATEGAGLPAHARLREPRDPGARRHRHREVAAVARHDNRPGAVVHPRRVRGVVVGAAVRAERPTTEHTARAVRVLQ